MNVIFGLNPLPSIGATLMDDDADYQMKVYALKITRLLTVSLAVNTQLFMGNNYVVKYQTQLQNLYNEKIVDSIWKLFQSNDALI